MVLQMQWPRSSGAIRPGFGVSGVLNRGSSGGIVGAGTGRALNRIGVKVTCDHYRHCAIAQFLDQLVSLRRLHSDGSRVTRNGTLQVRSDYTEMIVSGVHNSRDPAGWRLQPGDGVYRIESVGVDIGKMQFGRQQVCPNQQSIAVRDAKSASRSRLPAMARAITKCDVAEYIEARSSEDNMKPATVTKEISVLKHCLRLAVEWGELNQNAAAGARLPQLAPGRTRYLTPNELKAALEIAPEWLRAPMTFAASTGVRRGEMLALRWIDVDVDSKRLYLRETKNGALRILPISEAALMVLNSLPPARPAISSLQE